MNKFSATVKDCVIFSNILALANIFNGYNIIGGSSNNSVNSSSTMEEEIKKGGTLLLKIQQDRIRIISTSYIHNSNNLNNVINFNNINNINSPQVWISCSTSLVLSDLHIDANNNVNDDNSSLSSGSYPNSSQLNYNNNIREKNTYSNLLYLEVSNVSSLIEALSSSSCNYSSFSSNFNNNNNNFKVNTIKMRLVNLTERPSHIPFTPKQTRLKSCSSSFTSPSPSVTDVIISEDDNEDDNNNNHLRDKDSIIKLKNNGTMLQLTMLCSYKNTNSHHDISHEVPVKVIAPSLANVIAAAAAAPLIAGSVNYNKTHDDNDNSSSSSSSSSSGSNQIQLYLPNIWDLAAFVDCVRNNGCNRVTMNASVNNFPSLAKSLNSDDGIRDKGNNINNNTNIININDKDGANRRTFASLQFIAESTTCGSFVLAYDSVQVVTVKCDKKCSNNNLNCRKRRREEEKKRISGKSNGEESENDDVEGNNNILKNNGKDIIKGNIIYDNDTPSSSLPSFTTSSTEVSVTVDARTLFRSLMVRNLLNNSNNNNNSNCNNNDSHVVLHLLLQPQFQPQEQQRHLTHHRCNSSTSVLGNNTINNATNNINKINDSYYNYQNYNDDNSYSNQHKQLQSQSQQNSHLQQQLNRIGRGIVINATTSIHNNSCSNIDNNVTNNNNNNINDCVNGADINKGNINILFYIPAVVDV